MDVGQGDKSIAARLRLIATALDALDALGQGRFPNVDRALADKLSSLATELHGAHEREARG